MNILKLTTLSLALSGVLALPATSLAAEPTPTEFWNSLSSEQKTSAYNKWLSLSPAQQQAARKRADVTRAKWRSMTPEQQAAAIEYSQSAAARATEKMQGMTNEEKATMLNRAARVQERVQGMSDEQRTQVQGRMQKRLEERSSQ